MSLTKRGKYYHYDFKFRGERYQKTCETGVKVDAYEVQKRAKKQVRDGTYGKEPTERSREQRTLAAAIEGYSAGRTEQKSFKSARGYARVLAELLGLDCLFLELGHYDLLKLRDKIAERKVDSRHPGCVRVDIQREIPDGNAMANQSNDRLPKLSVATVNRYMEFLRRLILWACENWEQPIPNINWAKGQRDRSRRPTIIKSEKPRDRILKDCEARRFSRAASRIRPELLPFFEFEAETGLRTEVVVSLLWHMIDPNRRVANVVIGKVDAENSIHAQPLSPRAMQILRELKGQHPTHVFTLISRKPGQRNVRIPLTVGNFRRAFKEICSSAKIDNFHNHDFRHTAATRLVESGGTITDVQHLLGVRNVKTAMRYVNNDNRVASLQAKQKRLFK